MGVFSKQESQRQSAVKLELSARQWLHQKNTSNVRHIQRHSTLLGVLLSITYTASIILNMTGLFHDQDRH